MASLERDRDLNPRVEIMRMQRRKIMECEKAIYHEILDTSQNCAHVNGLLHQLRDLYQLHFMYEEQLLVEVELPSVADHRSIHELFLKTLDTLMTGDGQCHNQSYLADFINLRMDFIANVNKETMMICDFIIKTRGGTTGDMIQ